MSVPIHMPTEASAFLRDGIRGLQNFILLTEAGYVPKPAVLYGETNEQMAKVAQRTGFTTHGQIDDGLGKKWDIITAPFNDIKERVFSEEMLRMDKILSKRLGKVAVAN